MRVSATMAQWGGAVPHQAFVHGLPVFLGGLLRLDLGLEARSTHDPGLRQRVAHVVEHAQLGGAGERV